MDEVTIAIFKACAEGDWYPVWFLRTNNGADLNARNDNGATPLIIACVYGHLKVVQVLMENGTDINKSLPKDDGYTPLFIACMNGRLDVARLLVEKGADMNKATKMGDTPLKIAQEMEHVEVVAFLKETGATY